MTVIKIETASPKDKEEFNKEALHPLQAWQWGEFRQKTGIEVIRLGKYVNSRLTETAQLTIHPLPFSHFTIGYLPKSGIPSRDMLEKLVEIGKQSHCIFIKLEPNILKSHWKLEIGNWKLVFSPSPHPLFTRYTFQLDLTPTEEELLKKMHPKTRYNIKVAKRHNVEVKEDNTEKAFQSYLQLLEETTKRQKYFAHSRRYHTLMWETLHKAEIAHLFTANYHHNGKTYVLAAWIVFLFNGILYYPYGASSSLFRHTMASNLIMWEAIRFGKKHGAKLFDLWGALGPDPDPKDEWYGFHKFKQGFNPNTVEFAGSFDLIINPLLYKLYNSAYSLRQMLLRIKSHLRF